MEFTSPNASKIFLFPSINLFPIPLRRYFHAFMADSPDSANVGLYVRV